VNPGGVILVVAGVVMVLVGVRGSQSQVFAAVTGKGATKSTTATVTNFAPASSGAGIVPATSPTQQAPQVWA
jgi:hypothetical protein